MYGPTGTGILYGRQAVLEELTPWKGGGEMIKAVWTHKADWNDLPYKYEAGTPNICGVIALEQAVSYLAGNGMDAICEY